MIFKFSNIPEKTAISIFDKANNGSADSISRQIEAGDFELDFEIPATWEDPYIALAPFLYYVPNSYQSLDRKFSEFLLSGDNYYLDITRDPTRKEENRESVEQILIKIGQSEDLSGRQKFYVSLMALNSHFEFLTHSILVVSGYKTQRKFKDLGKHENRINSALDAANTKFFGLTLDICPGKSIEPGEVKPDVMLNCNKIMQNVRKLRNDVAHGWGYNDLSNDDIIDFFKNLDVLLPYSPTDEMFFQNAAQAFVSLWAKVQVLSTRAKIVHEKHIILDERAERGYT